MRRLILHHFYRASIRKAWVHMLSTRGGEKNDAKLTAVCIRRGLNRLGCWPGANSGCREGIIKARSPGTIAPITTLTHVVGACLLSTPQHPSPHHITPDTSVNRTTTTMPVNRNPGALAGFRSQNQYHRWDYRQNQQAASHLPAYRLECHPNHPYPRQHG
jgi:hypothetical protein